ncbi:type I addiction module toxin, SymE family [Salmonella enterica]|nr:type I addiction module toxin, SymE family [Salmonella enterica]EHG4385634.1 type I toxin-antitoxin system SymE family toxin [Salmonella enterica subsp. enterica serovar Typhimurium]
MNFPEYAPFASLRIKWKWLEATVFTTGTPVEIVVEDGKMVVMALAKLEKPVVKRWRRRWRYVKSGS